MSSTPPRIARLIRCAFTSEVPLEGWRHFHVISLRRADDGWQAELAASCDGARRVWVPAARLLKKEGWQPGWTPLRSL